MKCLLLTLALFSATLIPSAHAADALPYFGTLRAQVLSQLDLATNGVAEPDKKLVTALRKALITIDKTKPDYASGSKSLGKLAKALNRTSVSNVFAPVFQSTMADYVGAFAGEEDALTARLASTFPSKSKTAAQSALIQLLNALDGANTNDDAVVAAKFLSTAAKNLSTAAKNVDKAEDAPAPPAGLTATISGAVNDSFNDFNTTITRSGSSIGINSQTKPSASGIDSIIMELQNVSDGTQTVNVRGGYNQVRVGGRSFGGALVVNGTATITYDSATRVISGTFSFVGDEAGDSTATVTLSGSFNGTAL
jgi:hypothetical protein